jgi:hypothetical protein
MKKLSSREKKFIIVLLAITLSGVLYTVISNLSLRDIRNNRTEKNREKIMKISGMSKEDLNVAYQNNSNFCLINEDCTSSCCGTCSPWNKFYKFPAEDVIIYPDLSRNCLNVVSCVSNGCVATERNFLLYRIETLFK